MMIRSRCQTAGTFRGARSQQPDGETVDLSSVNVLFQCGVDYYSVTSGQGTKVPGPGIGKYHAASESWQPTLWVTLPPDVPADSTEDFAEWLTANPHPLTSSVPASLQADDIVPSPTGVEFRIEEVDSSVEFLVDSAAADGVDPDIEDASFVYEAAGIEAKIDVCGSDVSPNFVCLRQVHVPNADEAQVDVTQREDAVEIVVRDGDDGQVLLRMQVS